MRHAAPQQLQVSRDGLACSSSATALRRPRPPTPAACSSIEEALGGNTARQAFELGNVRIGAATTAAPEPATLAAILQAAVLALLGGVILNLMPCVFPVLSIKVLALVEHARDSRAERVRQHGLAYTAGVLARSRALGVAAPRPARRRRRGRLGLPAAVARDRRRCWPIVLLAIGLSLSGVFHLAVIAAGRWRGPRRAAQKAGFAGSFFTGVLAAVVATPCTAPFMGTAIGFALTQPAGVALAVILALGLGLALPFLVLTFAARAHRPPAAAGCLDGDAEAGAGLPGLRHGRLARLGARRSRWARPV